MDVTFDCANCGKYVDLSDRVEIELALDEECEQLEDDSMLCPDCAENVVRNTRFTHTFTVEPQDTNYMDTLFGGKLMQEMDICAGMAAKRALYDSEIAGQAATVHVDNIEFIVPGLVGDIIFLEAEIVELGDKSLTIDVTVEKETTERSEEHDPGERIEMCNSQFVFVAMNEDGEAVEHGLVSE